MYLLLLQRRAPVVQKSVRGGRFETTWVISLRSFINFTAMAGNTCCHGSTFTDRLAPARPWCPAVMGKWHLQLLLARCPELLALVRLFRQICLVSFSASFCPVWNRKIDFVKGRGNSGQSKGASFFLFWNHFSASLFSAWAMCRVVFIVVAFLGRNSLIIKLRRSPTEKSKKITRFFLRMLAQLLTSTPFIFIFLSHHISGFPQLQIQQSRQPTNTKTHHKKSNRV